MAADEEGDEDEEDEGEDANAKRERLALRDKLREQYKALVALLKGLSAA